MVVPGRKIANTGLLINGRPTRRCRMLLRKQLDISCILFMQLHWESLPPKSMLNLCRIIECVTCVHNGYDCERIFQKQAGLEGTREGLVLRTTHFTNVCYQSRVSGLSINSTSKAEKSILHPLRSIPGKVPVKDMCLLVPCTERLFYFWGELPV